MRLRYVVESAEWSIHWDGVYLTRALQQLGVADAQLTRRSHFLRPTLVHFGSRNLFLPRNYTRLLPWQKVLFTWFHGTDEDWDYIRALPAASMRAGLVHTSCELSRQQLLGWGVPEAKLRMIPLGVDLELFRPAEPERRAARRAELGIAPDAFVIGSFQKDGVGWGEGMEPKRIKGPDLLCDVVEALSQRHPLHVLLTGPARGYVKDRLSRAGVAHSHLHFDDFRQVAAQFGPLDAYLISARAEGGPKAILEALASGVPLVSTRVGMAPDVLHDGVNALLADIDDRDALIGQLQRLIEDRGLGERLRAAGLATVQQYSWLEIGRRYLHELYEPLWSR